MAINENDVKHVAKLAKFDLTPEEIKYFTSQFQTVLDYIDMLNELETKETVPTSQVTGLLNVQRKDEVKSYLDPDKLLETSSLPIVRGQIKVKSVF